MRILLSSILWISLSWTIEVEVATSSVLHVPSEYATILAGLDASVFGDTVLVAPGVYADSEERSIFGFGLVRSCAFLRDGVVLRSESGPTETIIDMEAAPGQEEAAIYANNLPSDATLVEGFTIQGASQPGFGIEVLNCGKFTLNDCIIRDIVGPSFYPPPGGGLRVLAHLLVTRCQFLNCEAEEGAAIYQTKGDAEIRETTFRQCRGRPVVLENYPGFPFERAHVEQCSFLECLSENGGILRIANPGGILVRACTFLDNISEGGAVSLWNMGFHDQFRVESCLFARNLNNDINSGGAAIVASGEEFCTILGNTFYDNTSLVSEGSTIASYVPIVFRNNVLVKSHGSQAISRPEHHWNQSGCNVFWDNPDGIGIPLTETDVEADPLFCSPEKGDFTVDANSPCLPGHIPNCGLIGVFGEGCGTISVAPTSWGKIKSFYRDGTTQP
jgi:hypothetical protein